MSKFLRLGVNVDHVATVRNTRGGRNPDPVKAAQIAAEAGADGITAHLREDRRHICDDDISRLNSEVDLPLNLEMAPTEEMLEIALRHKPFAVCIVPEKREERTTEGGLDVVEKKSFLKDYVGQLSDVGIRVSLFVEPVFDQISTAAEIGASVVELHTGTFCDASPDTRLMRAEFLRISKAADLANNLSLECHAGHGLGFDTVKQIASIEVIEELNVGHFLIGEAIFCGLGNAIRRFRDSMNEARYENLKNKGDCL